MWLRRFLLLALLSVAPALADTPSIDPGSGLVVDQGWELVRSHCGGCHSIQLVTQNRLNRNGWENTIRWMQEKQGLWDLGASETPTLDYLAKHYGIPDKPQRRKPLNVKPLDYSRQ